MKMKSGPTHAANVTLHANIVEIVVRSVHLSGVLLSSVPLIEDLLLSESSIVVKANLGVHAVHCS